MFDDLFDIDPHDVEQAIAAYQAAKTPVKDPTILSASSVHDSLTSKASEENENGNDNFDNFDLEGAIAARHSEGIDYVDGDEEEEEDLLEHKKRKHLKGTKVSATQIEKIMEPSEKDTMHLALESTLLKFFGHKKFRSGQLSVIRAVLERRDTAVFWATGAVSPLISLMMDQVININNTVGSIHGRDIACFLGSGQKDAQIETKMLRGDYKLVYVTPEKLSSFGFLEKFKQLHTLVGICLFAVDEAHCISQWGHNFRQEYRELGRFREALPDIPIMCLTATSVKTVKDDIVQGLKLRSPFISNSSCFRDNLFLKVTRKKGSGIAMDLAPVVDKLLRTNQSTIVYVPTKALTESISDHLAKHLPQSCVRAYHAGLSSAQRELNHKQFLTGKVQVVVATVAFGMGIDKPDVRNVFHYGAPKTFENYYQEIGRAGRDGLAAHCELIASDSDFDKYSSEFYQHDMTAEAKAVQDASNGALRSFSNSSACRWTLVLDFFQHAHPFVSCMNCDNCQERVAHATDLERDFTLESAALMQPEIGLQQALSDGWLSMTMLLKKISEASPTSAVGKRLAAIASAPKLSKALVQELVPALCGTAWIQSQKRERRGYASYTAYTVTDKARAALAGQVRVMLPVPRAIRDIEDSRRAALLQRTQDLKAEGIDLSVIPPHELEAGEGEIFHAVHAFAKRLGLFRRTNPHKAEQLLALETHLRRWREDTAESLQMAPANVLAEALIYQLCYVRPRTKESLLSLGVRIQLAQMEQLLSILNPPGMEDTASQASQASQGRLWVTGQARAWKLATVHQGKQPPSWELSYNRYQKGEDPESIALKQVGKGPILVNTVVSHLQQAIQQGRQLDINRLLRSEPLEKLPSESEWAQLDQAEVSKDLTVCNVDEKTFYNLRTKLLTKITNVVSISDKDRTQQERLEANNWYSKISWWACLKRCTCPVAFSDAEPQAHYKKPRID